MNHLLLIEHAAHFEVARAYAMMFLAAGWKVTLAINEKNHGFLAHVMDGKNHVQQLVLKAREDEKVYWKEVDKVASEADLIIVCSHENGMSGLIHDRWKAPCYLVIHDGYNYLDPYGHLVWKGGLWQWMRIVKYTASGYFKKRIQSARQYDGWLTPVDWPEEWKIKSKMSRVLFLPFLWYEGMEAVKSEKFHIVVPGTINQRSRDYELVKRLVERMNFGPNLPPCRITLLGKASSDYEKKMVEEIKNLSSNQVELVTFAQHINGAEFDAIMQSADLLFLPLQPSWQYGVVAEKGGLSCLSGNIGDMVRFGKKALLPKQYKIHSLLHENAFFYDDRDEENLWPVFKEAMNAASKVDYANWNHFVSGLINFK